VFWELLAQSEWHISGCFGWIHKLEMDVVGPSSANVYSLQTLMATTKPTKAAKGKAADKSTPASSKGSNLTNTNLQLARKQQVRRMPKPKLRKKRRFRVLTRIAHAKFEHLSLSIDRKLCVCLGNPNTHGNQCPMLPGWISSERLSRAYLYLGCLFRKRCSPGW
jgi:hypothetical protein